jgi:hypothetical protein
MARSQEYPSHYPGQPHIPQRRKRQKRGKRVSRPVKRRRKQTGGGIRDGRFLLPRKNKQSKNRKVSRQYGGNILDDIASPTTYFGRELNNA